MPVLTIGDKRILYIHVPKTGGTTVEHLLRSYGGTVSSYSPGGAGLPCSPQHFHGTLLKTVFGLSSSADDREHDFDFVFMTVRNPVSRLLSEYRYQRTVAMHPALTTDSSVQRRLRLKPGPVAQILSFDLWCRYAFLRYSRDQFFLGNHLRPQVEFAIWDPVVYRLEDGLEGIRQRLDELTGVTGDLPSEPRKVSMDRKGSAERLKSGTRRLIQDHFARDFAEYRYEFPASL